MVELNFSGKKHISLKRASEITGYARDYVGQLCRQQKIKGQLVGRSWFVNLEELVLYKKQQEENAEIAKASWLSQRQVVNNFPVSGEIKKSVCMGDNATSANLWNFWSTFKLTTLAAFLFFTFYFFNFTVSVLGGFEKQLDSCAQKHIASLVGVFEGMTLPASVEYSLKQGTLKEVNSVVENNLDILSRKIQKTLETVIRDFEMMTSEIYGGFISFVKNSERVIFRDSQNKILTASALPSQENSAGYFVVIQEEPYDLLWLVYVVLGVLSMGLVSNIYFKHRTNGFNSPKFNI